MSLRSFIAVVALLLATMPGASASVILHEGDVFTYNFSGLPDPPLYLPPGYGDTDGGGFFLRVSDYDAQTDFLRFEMFEDNLEQPNFFEAVVEAGTDGGFLAGTWADNQGVVRLTMVAGEVNLDELTFMHQVPLDQEGNIVRYFRTVDPVPEPQSVLMLMSGAALIARNPRRRRVLSL